MIARFMCRGTLLNWTARHFTIITEKYERIMEVSLLIVGKIHKIIHDTVKFTVGKMFSK